MKFSSISKSNHRRATGTRVEFQLSFRLSVKVLREERQVPGSNLTGTKILSKFVCQRIHVCVCACVRAWNERATTRGSQDSSFLTKFISILDISETQHIIFSAGQGH